VNFTKKERKTKETLINEKVINSTFASTKDKTNKFASLEQYNDISHPRSLLLFRRRDDITVTVTLVLLLGRII
jgi:hypothetical protein